MGDGLDHGRSAGKTTNRTAFDEWMDILRRMGELYGQLTEAEHAKRKAVRRGDLAEMQAAARREEDLLGRFAELDAARIERMTKWQRERGIKPDPRANLSAVIASLDDEAEREAVRRMQRELAEAARRLKAAAEVNRDLLQLSLDTVTALTAPGAPERDDYIYTNLRQDTRTGGGPGRSRPSGYDRRM